MINDTDRHFSKRNVFQTQEHREFCAVERKRKDGRESKQHQVVERGSKGWGGAGERDCVKGAPTSLGRGSRNAMFTPGSTDAT